MMVEDKGSVVGTLRVVALTVCVGLLVSCTPATQAHKSGPSSAMLTASTAATSSMSSVPAIASASRPPAATTATVPPPAITASPAANASPTTFAADELASLARLHIKWLAPMTGYSRTQFGPAWPVLAGCDALNSVLARDLTKTTMQGGLHRQKRDTR